MNKYLEKIAEILVKDLPYRKRVEVIIVKDGKVLVTKNKNKETGDEWYGFPGGGLDGDTPEETCVNECLEEVGIKIENPTSLSVPECTEEGMGKKDDRHLKYRGSKTKWYRADYVEVDRSKLGNDGDSRRYAWKTLQEALGAVKDGKGISGHRVKALNALKGSNQAEGKRLEKLAQVILNQAGLYHVSTTPLKDLLLTPRVPKNFLVDNGYEDSVTKRISFAPSIDRALLAISANLKGKKLYVYKAPDSVEHTVPSIHQVPDSSITEERWVLNPTNVEYVGKIEIGEAIEKPMEYKYGDNKAELYGWNWKHLND